MFIRAISNVLYSPIYKKGSRGSGKIKSHQIVSEYTVKSMQFLNQPNQ